MKFQFALFKCLTFFMLLFSLKLQAADGYKNFKVSVYCRVYEVEKMENLDYLKKRIEYIQRHVRLEKVYLETHRDLIIAKEATIKKAKKYLESQGIEVAGGITLVANERDKFRSFCYSKQDDLNKIAEILAYTAGFFDEIILDDFYFTNCKCEQCIAAKGNMEWSEFRMKQMVDAAETNVLKPARDINPDVKIIIKYPNWYEHFHYLGFDLEQEPQLFDGIYTGTETRDPKNSHQHLQQYQSYSIMRYFENISPGRNGGGWVDPYGLSNLDRYQEQLTLTAFVKPKEITLFAIHALAEEFKTAEGKTELASRVTPLAGYSFAKADAILGKLGNPVGIPCYRPYHSVGEDFLHNYLGMLGLPIEIVPEFPEEDKTIILTENASYDPDIVTKMKQHLQRGNNVIITSGLLKALQGNGIEDIAQIRYTDRKFSSNEFSNFVTETRTDKEILMPVIIYPTNDTWEVITAYSSGNGFPVITKSNYAAGNLYVLTIPDNYSDMYSFTPQLLEWIRNVLMEDQFLSLNCRSQVGLFTYDNNSFIVQSFLSEGELVEIKVNAKGKTLVQLDNNRIIEGIPEGNNTLFKIYQPAHSFQAFRVE